mmetsp:Transcript_53712/g.112097  ORF Transcript_53712/g.112097 Transcript_53712/m.112097 type:complete len:420 (+) Transcript_53712:1054-2313(+)
MEAKLSSMTMMSAAFCATCVPAMPMAKPTSARWSAGASLVPSPVTATVCGVEIFDAWMPVTRVSLSRGEERASTRRRGQILSNSSWRISSPSVTRSRNTSPVMTHSGPSPSPRIPHLRAIAWAVLGLSPVTIRTTMPAAVQTRMASGTSGRTGSSRPSRPTSVRPVSSDSSTASGRLNTSQSRMATARVRRPWSAKAPMRSLSALSAAGLSGSGPSAVITLSQSLSTISAAPLQCRRNPSPPRRRTKVLMRLRSEEKEMPQRSGSLAGYSVRSPLYPTLSPSSLLASTSIAHSVSLPEYLTTLPKESSSTSDLNDELITVPSASVCFRSRSSDADTSVEVSSSCPPTKTRTTVMRPVVRVPVLSEQMTLVQPSVSTAGRCRTRALRRARRCVPRARHVVTTAGRPSGIAATASTTAVLK